MVIYSEWRAVEKCAWYIKNFGDTLVKAVLAKAAAPTLYLGTSEKSSLPRREVWQMDVFERDEMIDDDNIPSTSKRLRGTLSNNRLNISQKGEQSKFDSIPGRGKHNRRKSKSEPSFLVNNCTVINLHGIKDSNYKYELKKMVAKLTDEEKIIITNVDDVFISGTIDYNKEDDCMGGCTYEKNKIIPAANNQFQRALV
uniref:Uncharacterized protein n=1 Tax=Glossina pallidipes TaxID=7398 RepID=A0A1A9Z0P2_GLOPL